MKSQKSIVRKAAKKRARRKDYQKRKNINDNLPRAKRQRLEPGFGLPESRKYTESKKTKKEKNDMVINRISRTSASNKG